MSRTYPERPIPGVAGMIIHGGNILLSVRGNPPSEGLWGLPGGAVEVGETVEEALVREVFEETGAIINPVKQVAVLDSINRDDDGRVKYHYILFEYLCEYVSDKIKPGSDAKEVRWVSLNDLESVDIMPITLRFIRRILTQEGIVLPNG